MKLTLDQNEIAVAIGEYVQKHHNLERVEVTIRVVLVSPPRVEALVEGLPPKTDDESTCPECACFCGVKRKDHAHSHLHQWERVIPCASHQRAMDLPGPFKVNQPSAPIGLLADAAYLCSILESHTPQEIGGRVTLPTWLEVRDAVVSLRASIKLHEGGPLPAALELEADEKRLSELPAACDGHVTGCYVRAKTAKGWESIDIWCLTRASLLAWVESRGPVGPFAKSVILILAGHRPEGPAVGRGPAT